MEPFESLIFAAALTEREPGTFTLTAAHGVAAVQTFITRAVSNSGVTAT